MYRNLFISWCIGIFMSKKKGIDGERSLVHLFWAVPGWVAMRVAGSGSAGYI